MQQMMVARPGDNADVETQPKVWLMSKPGSLLILLFLFMGGYRDMKFTNP